MISEERYSLTPEAHRNLAINLRQQLTTLLGDIMNSPVMGVFWVCRRLRMFVMQFVTSDRWCILCLLRQQPCSHRYNRQNRFHLLDDLNETQLIDLLNQSWFTAYSQSRKNRQRWLDAIEQVTRQLWEPLMAPLIDWLTQHSFQQVVLIPTGYLSLLPLHAAWIEDATQPTGKRYALDEVLFTYAPNARSLIAAETITKQNKVESILAIDNPLKDLPNSSHEVEGAIASFPQQKVLKHEEAAIETVLKALPSCDVLHLSCHGTANLREPLNSGLMMSDGVLTLRDLFDLRLSEQDGIRLAVLSACETGLVGV
jgi:CHAT domain-containing protein